MRKKLTALAVCFVAALSLFASQPPFPHVDIVAIAIKDGKVLMTKHTAADGAENWAPPSCHLKLGKTPSQCALDELAQKTGLIAKKAESKRWMNEVVDPLDTNTITLLIQVNDFEESELEGEGKWIDLSELPKDQLAQISIDQNAHLS